jgi:hypothetical protein
MADKETKTKKSRWWLAFDWVIAAFSIFALIRGLRSGYEDIWALWCLAIGLVLVAGLETWRHRK